MRQDDLRATASANAAEGGEERRIRNVLAQVTHEHVEVLAGVFPLAALESPIQTHFPVVDHFVCQRLERDLRAPWLVVFHEAVASTRAGGFVLRHPRVTRGSDLKSEDANKQRMQKK